MSLFRQHAAPCAFPADESWVILSPIEASIKRKIEAVGTPLSEWDISINYGIKTGCNEAFIISTARRDEILAACRDEAERERTAELIRPILRGRDIKRYGYEWAELWLIATFPSRHYDIEQYPAVRDYLLSFGREKLEQTGATYIRDGQEFKARKKTNNQWFETQDSISYWEDFDKPKIVWPSVGETFYCFVPAEYLLLDTNYFFPTDNPNYFTALLNSKLITWWINSEDTQIGPGGAYRHYKYNLEKLSLPQEISLLTDCNLNESHNEELFDKIINDFYGLTEEEINYIEALRNN